MKLYLSFILATVCLAACSPDAIEDVSSETTAPAYPAFTTYEASEFEPNWFLKIKGEEKIEFTQLDPVAGNDLVTYEYSITREDANSEGRLLEGSGPNGDIAVEIMPGQSCTHSGSGYTHSDTVRVTTSAQTWRGCGGSILEEPE